MECVVGLGSNVGDRLAHLKAALAGLSNTGRVRAVSRLYETAAIGPDQADFFNAAARLETPLEPHELLASLLDIERSRRRVRRERWGPRTLDLDVLWIRGLELRGDVLTVPHPRLSRRAFALLPLIDVCPDACDSAGIAYGSSLQAVKDQVVRVVAEPSWPVCGVSPQPLSNGP